MAALTAITRTCDIGRSPTTKACQKTPQTLLKYLQSFLLLHLSAYFVLVPHAEGEGRGMENLTERDEEGDKEKEEQAEMMGRKRQYFIFPLSYFPWFSPSFSACSFPFEAKALQSNEEAGGDPHC